MNDELDKLDIPAEGRAILEKSIKELETLEDQQLLMLAMAISVLYSGAPLDVRFPLYQVLRKRSGVKAATKVLVA